MQQKPLLLFSCNSSLRSRVGPALTHVLLSLQPLQELREVVLDILKAADQTSEGNVHVGASWKAGAWAGLGSLLLQVGKQRGLQSVPAPHVPVDFDGDQVL